MTTIHLQVEDDYIETFMNTLPKDKVVIIEEDFKNNQKKIQAQLKEYEDATGTFVLYYDSMKEMSTWLEQRKEA
ncbi:hypothetical protein [Sulfurimonas sp.]|uniref:hypothetical protein n=1 Tax=Sulfurimonas sp. TaxID=2022749 RepID=UPI0025F30F83|nr:hypothetical protein [Sulfurimonas sp.]